VAYPRNRSSAAKRTCVFPGVVAGGERSSVDLAGAARQHLQQPTVYPPAPWRAARRYPMTPERGSCRDGPHDRQSTRGEPAMPRVGGKPRGKVMMLVKHCAVSQNHCKRLTAAQGSALPGSLPPGAVLPTRLVARSAVLHPRRRRRQVTGSSDICAELQRPLSASHCRDARSGPRFRPIPDDRGYQGKAASR
jgi:hypothetical protein